MCNLLAQCSKGLDIRGLNHVANVQSQHPKLDIISEFHSVLYSYQSDVFIAAFGAAGVLSAIAASDPADQFEQAARNYLIGTSVGTDTTLNQNFIAPYTSHANSYMQLVHPYQRYNARVQ